jgi:hypothetical protein
MVGGPTLTARQKEVMLAVFARYGARYLREVPQDKRAEMLTHLEAELAERGADDAF